MNDYDIKELEQHLESNNGFAKWQALKALSIIKRLKAENEELKRRTQNLTSDLTSAKAEIERLKDYEALYKNLREEHLEIIKAIKFTKSEARKEFAERLNDYQEYLIGEDDKFKPYVSVEDLNNLLAEMENKGV